MPEKKKNKSADSEDDYPDLSYGLDYVEEREFDYWEGKEEIRQLFADEIKERIKDREFYDWDSQQFED